MEYVSLPPPQVEWRSAHGLPHRGERARSLRAGCQSRRSVLQGSYALKRVMDDLASF